MSSQEAVETRAVEHKQSMNELCQTKAKVNRTKRRRNRRVRGTPRKKTNEMDRPARAHAPRSITTDPKRLPQPSIASRRKPHQRKAAPPTATHARRVRGASGEGLREAIIRTHTSVIPEAAAWVEPPHGVHGGGHEWARPQPAPN